MEGIAPAESRFFLPAVLLRGGVQISQGAGDPDHLCVMRRRVAKAVRLKEAAAQHLGHFSFADGLDAFLPLAPNDIEEVGLQCLAYVVVLVWIGGQQRRHQSRPVHPGDRLHEMLKEVHDPLPPDLTHPRLPAGVHQHFIDQNQGAEALLRRDCQ